MSGVTEPAIALLEGRLLRWFTSGRTALKAVAAAVLAAAVCVADGAAADEPGAEAPSDEKLWSVVVFAGPGSSRVFSRTLKNLHDFDDNGQWLAAAALRRQIARPFDHVVLEAEGMFAQHWGSQSFGEFGAALNTRLVDSPWDHVLVTTFAIGVGPSLTTAQPEVELNDQGEGGKLLNQFNLELTLALPDYPDEALVLRLQHRSALLGQLNKSEGSEFVAVGAQFKF